MGSIDVARRLAADAATWPAEPSPDLAARVLVELVALDVGERPPRRPPTRRLAWALALPAAAALLVGVISQPAEPPAASDRVPAFARHAAPPPLYECVDRPLLEEWRRVSAEARGTARFLARQVSRPLRGLGLSEWTDG